MFFENLRALSARLDHVVMRCFKAESEIRELKRRDNSNIRALNEKYERDFRFFCGMYNNLRLYTDRRLEELKKDRDLLEMQIRELKESLASALSRLDAAEKRADDIKTSFDKRIAEVNSRLDAAEKRSAAEKTADLTETEAPTVFDAALTGTEVLRSGFDIRKYDGSDEKVTARQILNEWLNGDVRTEGKE